MSFSPMVSMELDDDDKLDAPMPIAMPDRPDYPYGLRICLTHAELEKLGLDSGCAIGDMIDIRAFAKVTSVSATDGPGGPDRRIELQIVMMSVESEETDEDD